MSYERIQLAKNDFGHMISTSIQGTIDITYHHTTISLKRADFVQFAHWFTQANLFMLTPSEQWQAQELPDGRVELWLGNSGLRMNVIEFIAFRDLLRTSLHRLETLNLDDLLALKPLSSSRFSGKRFRPSLN